MTRVGLDLRLLLPALGGWAVLVGALGAGLSAPAVGALAAGALAVAAATHTAATWAARRARAHKPGRRPTRAGTGDRLPAHPGAPRPHGPRRGARWASVVALSAMVTALLCAAAAAHLGVRDAGPLPRLAAQRAVVTVEGRIDEDPRLLAPTPERDQARAVTRVLVTSVTARGQVSAVRTPVVVLSGPELTSLRWRERVRLTGRLAAPDGPDRAVALLTPKGPVERLEEAGPVARAAEYARGRLREAVQPLPADPRGLVPALVIGDRSLTPPQLTDDMRATGMTHLSAVSGSNVTVILGAAVLVAGVLRVPRRYRPIVAAVALAGFVVLARPDPSVVRAAAMGAVGLIGVSVSRRAAGPPALAAAIVVLLCVDPWLARSYGFALSSLATLGLLLFARPWGAAIGRYLPARARPLADAVAIPLAAQATCAPVVVLLQGSVPIIGVLANLLAAVFVAPATVAGVLAALLATVWLPAGTALAWLAALPAWAIALVARTLAPVPLGTLPWPDGTPGALLLAALTVLALLAAPWGWDAARRRPRRVVAALLVIAAVCWPLPGPAAPTAWEFAACDVGQGDALVIATAPGRAVLVDAGPEPVAVRRCLDRLGVTGLDAIVLTHFHADHVDGLAGALAGRSVGALYVSEVAEPREQAQDVTQLAAQRGLAPVPVRVGTTLSVGGVRLQALAPARTIRDGSVPNNNGVVLDVRTASLRLLLLADAEREEGADLTRVLAGRLPTGADVDPPDAPPVDVVKVAHHGSSNLSRELVVAIAAPVAIISVGADNDYGHPTAAALEAYSRAGAAVLRTDRDGDILLVPGRRSAPGARVPIRVMRSRG